MTKANNVLTPDSFDLGIKKNEQLLAKHQRIYSDKTAEAELLQFQATEAEVNSVYVKSGAGDVLSEKDTELHYQRLKNAEQRTQINKLLRQLELKTKDQKNTKAKNIKLQMSREKDLKLFEKQEQAIYSQDKQLKVLRDQSSEQVQQVRSLKETLEQTIDVKMQYEEVLQDLLQDPDVVNKVLQIMQANFSQ